MKRMLDSADHLTSVHSLHTVGLLCICICQHLVNCKHKSRSTVFLWTLTEDKNCASSFSSNIFTNISKYY